MLSVGGMFSGIGMWELGLERAGMRVLWHAERDPFRRRVLRHNWPDVPCYPDVRYIGRHNLAPVDVVCGGFPCQDISSSGTKAGIAGARSGLWGEMLRVVRELRPRWLLVENVSDLRARGLGVVLGDLAAIGYDAEWDCVQALAVGAPHGRDRIWLVAYPNADGQGQRSELQPDRAPLGPLEAGPARDDADRLRAALPDAARALHRSQPWRGPRGRLDSPERWRDAGRRAGWDAEPGVGRVVDGRPSRLDRHRLDALGNALVPQIAEALGRRILEWEGGLK